MRPTEIKLHQKENVLELTYENGETHSLTCEYLRVHSPSAEVQGHGPGQEVLQFDKEDVSINEIEPVGHYAIKLVFDDGHDSGIYSWETLYDLGDNLEEKWSAYLQRLDEAGYTRKKEGDSVFHS